MVSIKEDIRILDWDERWLWWERKKWKHSVTTSLSTSGWQTRGKEEEVEFYTRQTEWISDFQNQYEILEISQYKYDILPVASVWDRKHSCSARRGFKLQKQSLKAFENTVTFVLRLMSQVLPEPLYWCFHRHVTRFTLIYLVISV